MGILIADKVDYKSNIARREKGLPIFIKIPIYQEYKTTVCIATIQQNL